MFRGPQLSARSAADGMRMAAGSTAVSDATSRAAYVEARKALPYRRIRPRSASVLATTRPQEHLETFIAGSGGSLSQLQIVRPERQIDEGTLQLS
jgi:hypothetical protein